MPFLLEALRIDEMESTVLIQLPFIFVHFFLFPIGNMVHYSPYDPHGNVHPGPLVTGIHTNHILCFHDVLFGDRSSTAFISASVCEHYVYISSSLLPLLSFLSILFFSLFF